MPYFRWFMILLLALAVFSCSTDRLEKAKTLIAEGEYDSARKILENDKAQNNQTTRLLLATSYSKEFYPTYDLKKYSNPLTGQWELYPSAEMSSEKKALLILDELLKKGFFDETMAEEYYFHLVYNYYRYKYQNDFNRLEQMQRLAEILVDNPSGVSDKAFFWQIYINKDFSMNFNWLGLKVFFDKYPESELKELESLTKIMPFSKETAWQKDEILLTQFREFKKKNPELQVFADSLFIYRVIDDKLTKMDIRDLSKAETFLNSLLSENLSVDINRAILKELAFLEIKKGNTRAGLAKLTDLAGDIRMQSTREKLNHSIGKLAFEQGEMGLAVMNLRQVKPSVKVLTMLWEAYLKMNNQVEANLIYQKLEPDLSKKEKKRLNLIQYEYNLEKLLIKGLNTVQGRDNLNLEAILVNPTDKTYYDIVVTMSLITSSGYVENKKATVISELYPNTEEKFNISIELRNKSDVYSADCKIIRFKRVE